MHVDRRLWALTKGFRGQLALSVALGIGSNLAWMGRLALIGWLLAEIIASAPAERLLVVAILVLAAMAARSALQYAKDMVAHRATAAIQRVLREKLFGKLLELGPAELVRRRSGELTVTLSESVELLESFFGQYLPQLAVAMISPFVIVALLVALDPAVALAYLVTAIATFVFPSAFRKWLEKVSIDRWRVYARFASELIDSVQGLATLKAFGQGRARTELIARRAEAVFRGTMGIVAANSTSRAAITIGMGFGAAAIVAMGAVRVATGELGLAGLLVLVLVGVEIFRPFKELSSFFHAGLMGLSATTDVVGLLEAPVQMKEGSPDHAPVDASLVLEGVTFSYPGRSEPALRDVSFTVHSGERLGVVGPSGAGKSTLLWLLLRLYDVDRGRVIVGRHDVRSLSFSALRRQIAIVTQDPYLFHGTVATNLRVAKPDATDEELERAARAANAHDFITRLPHGYHTVIGERGARLSGGERQRLAIARALLRDAPILLLDEALSSVDARNEEVIQQALTLLMRGRTTLVIAHRLSSVVDCDRIVVLERGRLVEEGTHHALLARGGVYAALMAEQSRASETAAEAFETESPSEEVTRRVLPIAPRDDILGASTGAGWVASARTLWRAIGPYKLELALVILLAFLPAATTIALGVAGALAFAAVARGADPTIWLLALVVLAPVGTLAMWLDNFTSHDLAFRILVHIRVQLFRVLERLAPAYMVRRRSGDIVGLATHDIEMIELFYAHTIGPTFAVLVPVAIVIALALVDVRLALALAPFLAGALVSVAIGRSRVERLAAQAREQLGSLNAYTIETLQGIRDVFAFGHGGERARGFSAITRAYEPVRVQFNAERATQYAVLEVMIGLGGLVVTLVGAIAVAEGRLDGLALPPLVIVSMLAFGPLSSAVQTGRQLAETLAAARRLAAVDDEPIPVRDGPAVVGPRRPKGVRFEGVRFQYEGTTRPALDGVSFALAPGSTTALVGPSGAGKTTIAHLLMRFWDPNEGRIVLDGRDLREYQLDPLRGSVALVAQETYLFNTSIRENILVARPQASESELRQAVVRSGVAELADTLPDGLETYVGERGAQLSGGQRQRIAIARAFLKDAPFLVLDEATSHLDTENERIIRAALAELSRDRTTLVIAHRLSTVRSADTIVVLERGRVVEVGTHDDLVRASGLYAGLVSAQVRAARPLVAMS